MGMHSLHGAWDQPRLEAELFWKHVELTPVIALPLTSRPIRATGMQAACAATTEGVSSPSPVCRPWLRSELVEL